MSKQNVNNNKTDKYKQMFDQQQMIEERRKAISEKIEGKKRREAEEKLIKSHFENLKAELNAKGEEEGAKKTNIFVNDGSFLEQFKKLSNAAVTANEPKKTFVLPSAPPPPPPPPPPATENEVLEEVSPPVAQPVDDTSKKTKNIPALMDQPVPKPENFLRLNKSPRATQQFGPPREPFRNHRPTNQPNFPLGGPQNFPLGGNNPNFPQVGPSPPNFLPGGIPPNFPQSGPPPNFQQGGPPQNFPQGGPPNFPQGGPLPNFPPSCPPNFPQGGPPPPNFPQGVPPAPNFQQGGPPPNFPQGGPPSNFPQGGPGFPPGGPPLPNGSHPGGPPHPNNLTLPGGPPGLPHPGRGPPGPPHPGGAPPGPPHPSGGLPAPPHPGVIPPGPPHPGGVPPAPPHPGGVPPAPPHPCGGPSAPLHPGNLSHPGNPLMGGPPHPGGQSVGLPPLGGPLSGGLPLPSGPHSGGPLSLGGPPSGPPLQGGPSFPPGPPPPGQQPFPGPFPTNFGPPNFMPGPPFPPFQPPLPPFGPNTQPQALVPPPPPPPVPSPLGPSPTPVPAPSPQLPPAPVPAPVPPPAGGFPNPMMSIPQTNINISPECGNDSSPDWQSNKIAREDARAKDELTSASAQGSEQTDQLHQDEYPSSPIPPHWLKGNGDYDVEKEGEDQERIKRNYDSNDESDHSMHNDKEECYSDKDQEDDGLFDEDKSIKAEEPSDDEMFIKTEPYADCQNVDEYDKNVSIKNEAVEPPLATVKIEHDIKMEVEDCKIEDQIKMENRIKMEDIKTEIKTESGSSARGTKRRSRWGDAAPDVRPPGVVSPAILANAAKNTPAIKVTGMSGCLLSKVNKRDKGLLQYALSAYGSTNLSDEDWKKAEDNYKIHLLYQDMMQKRAEVERLMAQGKNKYEYDSDEDIEGGTWEHRAREKEMIATKEWASKLTEMARGKHHIGDFLPPEELKKFMDKYITVKGGGVEPDLSDYKEFKLTEENKGFQMLQKLGWSEGQGLGADGSGIVEPVNKARNRDTNMGLGAERPDDVASGDDEYEAYRKRMMLAYRFRPNPLNNPRRPYY